MTDNITHERVTQLLLDVMEFTYNSDSLSEAEKKVLDDIRAALEAQEDEALLNEPVAMRYDGDGYGYLYIDSGSGSDWQRRHKDAEPLYLAPPKPHAKREPATDEQIIKSHMQNDRWILASVQYFYNGWRQAERFHGIKKEDKT